MSLGTEIKKVKPFDALEQEAMLNIARTADVLHGQMEEVLKAGGVSATQYNVLRILRGAGESMSCGEIAGRMIAKDPDMTRLLDRLEKRGLVSRCREQKDRRVVSSRITDAGLKVLSDLDPIVIEAHRRQLGHMGQEKLKQLIALLEEARQTKNVKETP